MPQTAIQVTSFQGPNGSTVIGKANGQGLLMPNPSPGNSFFVNVTNGSDTTGLGTPYRPFATLDAAYEAAVANNNDYVYFWGTQARTSTLTWAKNGVSLVSLNAPSENGRGRITGDGSTVFTPLVNVTAQGCRFIGIGTFYGYDSATAQVCWAEAGGRNYYEQCQFKGGAHATAAAQAGCRSMTIENEGENFFIDCEWGLDTVTRATAANATLEFIGGAGQRNVFVRPRFLMYSSLATNVHVKAAASSTDREQIMYDAVFANSLAAGATSLTAAVSWAASAALLLAGMPFSYGAGKIAASGAVFVGAPAVSGTAGGLAIAAT